VAIFIIGVLLVVFDAAAVDRRHDGAEPPAEAFGEPVTAGGDVR